MTDGTSATYAAQVITAWASKYLPEVSPETVGQTEGVRVRETGRGKYEVSATAGRHHLLADEPVAAGGLDSGPSPYDFLSIALGACAAMTLRVYANHKRLTLGRISVAVSHGKVAAEHCLDCGAVAEGRQGKVDRFERVIALEGTTDTAIADRLLEIAGKCPVHRTLEESAAIVTTLAPTT